MAKLLPKLYDPFSNQIVFMLSMGNIRNMFILEKVNACIYKFKYFGNFYKYYYDLK
jgi:hypothetical protein